MGDDPRAAAPAAVDLGRRGPRMLADWADQVRGHLQRWLGDERLASDLAQEAVLRLLRATAAGQELREPRAWLFRTARNLAVDEVRRRAPMALGLEWQQRTADPSSLPREDHCFRVGERVVQRGELLELLPRALDDLPARDRRYLVAYYRDEHSCEELAGGDAISVQAAKVRLYRARQRLRRLLLRRACLGGEEAP